MEIIGMPTFVCIGVYVCEAGCRNVEDKKCE